MSKEKAASIKISNTFQKVLFWEFSIKAILNGNTKNTKIC